MSSEKKIFLDEEEKLQIRLNRTHTERFRMLMKLIRLSRNLKKAKITEAKSREKFFQTASAEWPG